MKSQPFIIERILNAPISKVWEAITDKNKMKEWYFDIEQFELKPGYEFSFEAGPEGKLYKHECRILEIVPQKKLSYSWSYAGHAGYSVVTFELEAEGNKTKIKLTHDGLDSFPKDDKNFARESFAAGWTQIVGSSLRDFVEKN